MENWEFVRGRKSGQAYDRLAEVLFPLDYIKDKKRCIDKVYSAFRYAESKRWIKLKTRTDKDFWIYTLKKYPLSEYPQLLKLDWIHPEAFVMGGIADVEFEPLSCSAICINMFESDNEYKAAYVRSETGRIRLLGENIKLVEENKKLVTKVHELEEKVANKIKSGKQSGGIRHK